MPNYRSRILYSDGDRGASQPGFDAGEIERPGYYSQMPVDGGARQRIEWVMDVLYRRKWLILATFVLVLTVVLYRSFNKAMLYESRSYVMVDLTRQPVTDKVAVNSTGYAVRSQRSIWTEIFILQNSGMIADRVGKALTRMKQSGALKGHVPSGSVFFGPAQRTVDNIIEVAVTSRNPEDAALLANLYAEEYVTQTQEMSRNYLTASRTFLEDQESKHQGELAGAEERIEAYKRANGAVALSREGSTVVGQIATLEAERDNARIELEMRRATLKSMEDELNAINPQLARRVGSDVEARLKMAQEKLSTVQAGKQEMLLRNPGLNENSRELQDFNYQITQLRSSIADLSQQLVDEVMAAGGVNAEGNAGLSYASDLKRQSVKERIEISGIEARLAVIDRRLNLQQAELSRIPEQEIELARLERERQHSEQMYQFIVGRLQETKVSEQSEPGYAKVIGKAHVPSMPKNASDGKDIMLSILMALALGVGLALVRDKIDSRFYKPHQLRNTGYDVISVIPNMRPILRREYAGKKYVEQDGKKFSTSFVALLNPMSSAAEAYRSLRTTIQFSRPDSIVQTVLVTSSSMEEGKSTTASNLAIVMAQAGRKTLLIDADLRRPNQHNLFGEALAPGLAQLLFSKEEFNPESFRTSVDDLYLIKAGANILAHSPKKQDAEQGENNLAIVNPSELLGSKRMRELLETFRQKFDVVIIDTPPVLVATDAALLSTQADATLVVTRAGRTREGDLEETSRILADVGAQVIGVLFNGFDLSHAYGYTYRYQQYSKASQYGAYYYGDRKQQNWKKKLFSKAQS